MAGSMEPERVPIMRPSSGVKPMVVSMDFPWLTAVMEPPLPKWHVMRPKSRSGRPSRFAACWAA